MTMDHDSNVEIKIDQTIQWARESLQRRRSDLLKLKEKKNLIISREKDNDDEATSSSVHAMLERGRALLAEAEAQADVLGKYASTTPSDKERAVEPSQSTVRSEMNSKHVLLRSHTTNGDGFMTRFLQKSAANHNEDGLNNRDSSSNTHMKSDVRELPLNTPDWNNVGGENEESSELSDKEEALNKLLREGEARAKLDDLIATVRQQGDGPSFKRKELVETPTKRVSSFDPSSLKSAKRAALKKISWDAEVAAADEEARLSTSFKALPLPGGVEVKHDLFASTQSFQGKLTGSVEKLVRRDTLCGRLNDTSSSISGTFGAFEGISIATSRTSHGESFSFHRHENEADRERAKYLRAEKKRKKRQLLDAVNQLITGGIKAPIEDDGSVFCGEGGVTVEDPLKLRQDIARLEAKLKQKKTQRLATLNDIVDIDLDAPFDRLHSKETGDDVNYIIDRLKNQICGSLNDFHIIPDATVSVAQASEPQRKSLFRRQEEWSIEREQKLFDARLKLEVEAMYGITGTPQLSHATQSWEKAKESHDETLKKVTEEEKRKQEDKEAKEKVEIEMKQKEMEKLQKEATSKLKSMKTQVNKEEQTKRLESLARPRQIREPIINVEPSSNEHPSLFSNSEIFLPSTPPRKHKSKSEKKTSKSSKLMLDRKLTEFCGKPSFSEMSDKDFAKLVKRIGKDVLPKSDVQVEIIMNPETLPVS